MHDLKNMQLMGGHQIIDGIRKTYRSSYRMSYLHKIDLLFIDKLAEVGTNM